MIDAIDPSVLPPLPWLYWVGVGSSALSALACLSIAAAALAFLRRRHDLAAVARRLGYLLVAFLLVVALTHLTQAVAPWTPAWRIEIVVRVLTAVVSIGTAILVWPQIPRLLDLPSPRDLARSNAALAQTNASLEATIAWRTHELRQANERFELALSSSNITVFSLDRNLAFTWIHNPRPGLTPEVAGSGAVEAGGEVAELARDVLRTGRTTRRTVSINGAAGVRHYDLTVGPTRNPAGAPDGALCTALDVTEKRNFDVQLAAMAAQVAGAYNRFELALEDSPISVFEQDRKLRYTFAHNPPSDMSPEDFLGRSDADVLSEPDQDKLIPAKRRVLDARMRESLGVELTFAGIPRFYEIRLEPKIGDNGEVEGLISTCVDLTERQHNERQMRLVMRELTHRSKNLLAVVQAMARKTASTALDIDAFIRDFSSRLRAIAAAQDLLVAESWSGAEMRDVLSASLSQTVDPAAPEIHIEGAPLKLSPDATQTLGLAFHELTMNAAKHGALSVPGGRLSVDWEHVHGEVRVDWREEGGPEVVRPDRSGFGRVLLERLVSASLGGDVALEFRPEGLACRITFPESRLISV